MTDRAALEATYHELQAYSLMLGDATFIHQHVVDAWAAQMATPETKPVKITFALAGLYLHLERGLTGREVQLVHIAMARVKRPWLTFALPATRGTLSPIDVMSAPPGTARHAAIDAWCHSVWSAYASAREPLVALLEDYRVDIDRIVGARNSRPQ